MINLIKDAIINSQKCISLMWAPGHASIEGNEIADLNAKEALKNSVINNNWFIFSDYIRQIKNYIYEIWSDEWSTLQNNKLFEILPSPTKKFSNLGLNRKDKQKITRLRIGHSNITHKFLIEKTDPPVCDCALNSLLSIKHIFNCSKYRNIYHKYKIDGLNCLKDENVEKAIKFIIEIDLYTKI